MKIIFIEWKSFGKDDIVNAMRELGHTVICYSHPEYNMRESESFSDDFDKFLSSNPADMVFSSNYYPLVSDVCNDHNIIYTSWIYDSPYVYLYSPTVLNPCNRIYIFDSSEYDKFHSSGINTVYYLPLAAPCERYDKMIPDRRIHQKLDCDISFIGSMYDEKHNLYDREFGSLSDYSKGYLDAVMNAQMKIYGEDIVEPLLKGKVIDDIRKNVNYSVQGAETEEYVYANYFIDRKITSIERKNLLNLISSEFHLKIYTHNPTPYLPNAENMGPVDYIDVMPYVFKCSKINLNITLRSIHSGIPLRAFDIMGSGGFLLTNFQSDFPEYFEPDRDFVYFESPEDMTDKCRFYLKHDELRQKIAENGYEKVKKDHTYKIRLSEILYI